MKIQPEGVKAPAEARQEQVLPKRQLSILKYGRQTDWPWHQFLPFAGHHDLSNAEAKAKPANFLFDDLKTRLASGPVIH